MSEVKTAGLGFAKASEIKIGDCVVVGGVIRRVLGVSNDLSAVEGNVSALVAGSMSTPLFNLDQVGWVSWQNCSVYVGRTIKELAREALDIQNACNPLGLSKGYARALQELREALEAEGDDRVRTSETSKMLGEGAVGYTGSEQIATHAINRSVVGHLG